MVKDIKQPKNCTKRLSIVDFSDDGELFSELEQEASEREISVSKLIIEKVQIVSDLNK